MNQPFNSKLVSIIILSYKNLEGVYTSLRSVFDQTYHDIEIVISDDGTPDFESRITQLKDFISQNKKDNIKNIIINSLKTNVGIVRNLNTALSKANGKYLKPLSAEDTFSCSEALNIYVDFMEENSSQIAFAKLRGIAPDGSIRTELAACESNYDLLKTYTPEDTLKRLYRRNFLPAPAWIIRRDLFDEYGYFLEDTRLIEDYPYWIYLSKKGVHFDYIDKVLIDYKLSGVSSAGKYSMSFMDDMQIIYDKYIFPYDTRFGILQPIYNLLKKGGLNYYKAEANWDNYTAHQRFTLRIKYFPFDLLVKTQNKLLSLRNRSAKDRKEF